MDRCELIELFYNRTYEKFVNKQILDDKNYIVPRQQLTNYVHELVKIPYIEYVNYIKQGEIDRRLEISDITQFSSFSICGMEMCKALLWANNPGCQYVDIGRFFPDMIISRSETAYRRIGEINIKASSQLGLTFEYYNYWYLSCLGYIYPELEKDVRIKLLARTIIRNRLYQQLLIDILDHNVNPEVYINVLPNYNFKRCQRSVCYFLNICLDICRKEGIKVHNLIKRYEYPKEIIQDDNPLETNERIDKYLTEIARQEFLSIDEEIELALKNRKGEVSARNKLVSSNLRFVVGPVKQYLHKGLEFEDLLHEGFLGLIKAVDFFDETRGIRFFKYSLWWIRSYLSHAIISDSTLIKFPLRVRILHKRVKDFKVKYEHQYGFMPPVTEIEIDDEDNHEIISYLNSLPDNLKDTCISYEDLDVFEDNHNDILDFEDNEDKKIYVSSLLARLSKRERNILIRIFGIGVKEETLESIGDTFGLTRERVRQIKEIALKKLRDIIQLSNADEQEEHEEDELIKRIIRERERRKIVHRLLKKAEINKSDNYHNGQNNSDHNDALSVSREINEFDGVRRGERIVYDGKECTICKIIVKENYSRFLIKYNNEILDYVPNDKSRYVILHSKKKCQSLTSKEVDSDGDSTPYDFNEIQVGDKIKFNSKSCLVLEKNIKYNILRLKVKYNDGRIDTIANNVKSYKICNNIDKGANDDNIKLTIQDIIERKSNVTNVIDETKIIKNKSREELYNYYIQLITNIKQAVVKGEKILAKPALILAVMDSINNGEIVQNKILLTAKLEKRYKYILSTYTGGIVKLTNILMPYWYLQYDDFWSLEYFKKYNGRNVLTKKWFLENIKYAKLDNDLWYLIQDDFWRKKLCDYIIENKLKYKPVVPQKYEQIVKKNDKRLWIEKNKNLNFVESTSLNILVEVGAITKKQLKHCHKKKLWTIGDVKNIIEYYHLTPDSTRFTKYTINLWFDIIALLNNNV